MDDGSFVQIWFATAHGAVSYRVGLSGCRFGLPDETKLKDFGRWPDQPRFTLSAPNR
jgi:hypothetical protein